MKLNFFACLILGLLVVPGFDASPAQLNADASVINAFLLMCTLEKPDFDALDKKSTAMRMLVVSDKTTKIPGGSSHEKSWYLPRKTAQCLFVVNEMSAGQKHSITLAIVAPLLRAESFKLKLISQLKLAP